jgi:hypothetical protein
MWNMICATWNKGACAAILPPLNSRDEVGWVIAQKATAQGCYRIQGPSFRSVPNGRCGRPARWAARTAMRSQGKRNCAQIQGCSSIEEKPDVSRLVILSRVHGKRIGNVVLAAIHRSLDSVWGSGSRSAIPVAFPSSSKTIVIPAASNARRIAVRLLPIG